jgi:hypothetical protein
MGENQAPQAPTPATVKSADEIIAFALSHPIRVGALRIFNEREASVSQVARELRENAKKVGNHIRALLDHGCIEWTRTDQKRGADEHFYRVSTRRREVSPTEWERMGLKGRSRISANEFLAATAEGLAAIRSGKMDMRLDRHLGFRATDLDEQGWNELAALLEETAHRADQIEHSARSRSGISETSVPVFVTLIAAERAPDCRNAPALRLALPPS